MSYTLYDAIREILEDAEIPDGLIEKLETTVRNFERKRITFFLHEVAEDWCQEHLDSYGISAYALGVYRGLLRAAKEVAES